MTDTSTEAVMALLDGVTPGPWEQSHRQRYDGMHSTEVYPANDPDNTIATVHWHSVKTDTGYTTDRAENARLIAAARDLVPTLLAEREALAADVARLTAERDAARDLALDEAAALCVAYNRKHNNMAVAFNVKSNLSAAIRALKYAAP